MIPDLKTPLLYVLGILLVCALATVGIERTQVLKARADTSEAKRALTAEQLDRSQVNEARSRAALRLTEKAAADSLTHATAQQETSNALSVQTAARLDADHRNAALNLRMRDTAEALRAALALSDAEGHAAAGEHPGDRPDTLERVAGDGGLLLARSGEVVAALRSDLAKRDAEVAALKATVDNDRVLFKKASDVSLLPDDAPAKLPTVFKPAP